MAFKLKSPRNLIIVSIAIVVLWIIYWFYHFTNKSVNTTEEQINEPTIGYEFGDITFETGHTSFIHLNKEILQETLDDDQQSDENENSNDMEYVDYNDIPKNTKKTPNSFTFMKPSVKNEQKYRFTHKVFTPDKTKNVFLDHSSISPRTEGRKIDDYYQDDKETVVSKGPYVLIHNAAASIVNIFQEVPLPFPVHIPKHLYTFTSERYFYVQMKFLV